MAALSVSDLLKLRETGDISREEFFKQLALIQAPPAPSPSPSQPKQASPGELGEPDRQLLQQKPSIQSAEQYAVQEPLGDQPRQRQPQQHHGTAQLLEPLEQQHTQPLFPSHDWSSPPLPPPLVSNSQTGIHSMTSEHPFQSKSNAHLWASEEPSQLPFNRQPYPPEHPSHPASSRHLLPTSASLLVPEAAPTTSMLSDLSSTIWDASDNQVTPSAQELLARAMREARQKLKLEDEADGYSSSGPVARPQEGDGADGGEQGLPEYSQPTWAWTEDDSPGSSESWDGPYAHQQSVGSRSESSFSAFTNRGQLWELRRSQRAQEMRQRAEAKEVEGCTFHPTLSTQKSVGGEVPEEKTFNAAQTAALVQRLTQPTQPRVSVQTEAWLAQREEESMKDCTFQPNLHRSASSYDRASNDQWWRSLSEARLGTSRRENDAKRDPDLTFAPQTNIVRKEMVNAQSYLQADVFARLSQVSTADGNFEVESLNKSMSTTSRIDGFKLDGFLERQRASEERKKSRLENLQATYAPAFRPQLVDRKSKKPGDEIISKPEKSVEPDLDPECTFRPKITQLARERQGRPFAELGPGDMKRREARRAKAAEEQRRQEAGQLKSPQVNSYNGVQGRLRLRENADTLMERIEKKRVAERARCQNELKSRQQKEEAQCSFKPEVKSAPAWISRMAASRRSARESVREDVDDDEDAPLPQRSEW
eukprot:CAMPEP_0206436392 /NCGR_PEP_ID=MMETSP0324_2-20121206/10452_1 /ASSEMBLY_ACC=CAM_ASM_000836 /TAXON_ID=2866 /ORGANISM="Crypthecodinium cohnii, Strain Seligo" /LENGTH=706 /DNA_ID=CAMNT_0053903541 /DNA_START=59 /DNA_END=2176 /DNA_ORIENTATION=+